MVPLMAAAQLWGVVQLGVLGTPARTLRWRTLLIAFVLGLSAAPLIAGLLEWAAVAARGPVTGPRTSLDQSAVVGYTVGPFAEELAKVLPVVVACLVLRVRRQLSATDIVLLSAAVGAGFGLTEVLARFADDAGRVFRSKSTGGWVLPVSIDYPQIPDGPHILGSWLPAGVSSGSLIGDPGAGAYNTHLAWSAVAGVGIAMLLIGRGWWRWLGVLALVAAGLDHATYNYDALRGDTPFLAEVAPAFRAVRNALPLYPLVVLAGAMLRDRWVMAGRHEFPGWPAAAVQDPRRWPTLGAYRRLRRTFALQSRAAPVGPATAALWNTVRDTAERLSTPWPATPRRRPRGRWLIAAVAAALAVPALGYLVVGTVPSWTGVQRWFGRAPGVYVVAGVAATALCWAFVRSVRRLAALPRLARSPYGPAIAHDVLALQALMASVAAGILAVVALSRGAHLTDDVIPAFLYQAMTDTRWWQWLMLAGLAVALVLVPEVAIPVVGAAGVIVIGGSIIIAEASDGPDSPGGAGDTGGEVTAARYTAPAFPPDPDRKPRGKRTEARNKKERRGLHRENDAADTLARRGYDVEQNPGNLPGTDKLPDYRIQGEYWDCYAPQTKNLRTIRGEIKSKVDAGVPRVVLNLDDYPGTIDLIRGKLLRDPVRGLKEILVVRNGTVIPFFPF